MEQRLNTYPLEEPTLLTTCYTRQYILDFCTNNNLKVSEHKYTVDKHWHIIIDIPSDGERGNYIVFRRVNLKSYDFGLQRIEFNTPNPTFLRDMITLLRKFDSNLII
jgi:hypothetical protein